MAATGSWFWHVERRLSRNSKNYELLPFDLNPLFFRSLDVAEKVAQFCNPEPREEAGGRLFWMPQQVLHFFERKAAIQKAEAVGAA